MRVLVTGATGFVGNALSYKLIDFGCKVTGSVRQLQSSGISKLTEFVVPDINDETDWSIALEGIQVVVHTAARVHVMHDQAQDPLAQFRRVNVDGTLNLARQASAAGVRRFIFISSVKVNGESTAAGQSFTAEDTPAPHDDYGLSKHEAEQALRLLAVETGLEVVIIRPPLVYGPGVKANFLSMLRWLKRGIPLPLGAIHNRRSLVALENLIDLIIICIDHPAAAGETLLVSDDEDISTTDLLYRVAEALNLHARLIPVPVWFLEAAAGLLGKQAVMRRLCGNLQIDISRTKMLLDWRPPISLKEGLRRAAQNRTEGTYVGK